MTAPDCAGSWVAAPIAKVFRRLLHWCDPAGSLAAAYAQVAERAAQCRAQNDRNGALVSARLARVQNMLGMLNMGSLESQTYGAPAGGPSNIRAAPGRLLVTSA